MSAEDGDELLRLLCAGNVADEEAGILANQLLTSFHRGYPVSNISCLIHSDNEKVVKIGAWLVSELGVKAAPILDEIGFLLDHPVRNARYYAIEAVLAASSSENSMLNAKAMRLIFDPDNAVRRLAIRLLARAERDQLASAVPYLTDEHMVRLTSWLLTKGSEPEHLSEILRRLTDPDKATRMFAAAAAARVASADREGLRSAATSDDPDVRKFAQNELELWEARDSALNRRRNGEGRER